MLRAQAFEGLLTLVPILLVAVVSIFLRARAARRRRQREEAAAGAPERGAPTPTTQAQTSGRPIPPKRARAPARGAQFSWQQEKANTAPVSAAPLTPGRTGSGRSIPQQPRRPQAANRENYAYPPPLYLNDSKPSTSSAAGLKGAPLPRPVVRPAAESRRAIERMTTAKRTESLQERMQSRAKLAQPAAESRKYSSITAKLEKLPPLKRAVIWAEILGPPGGRQ